MNVLSELRQIGRIREGHETQTAIEVCLLQPLVQLFPTSLKVKVCLAVNSLPSILTTQLFVADQHLL